MQVHRSLSAAASQGIQHLAIGYFDGLHRGHRAVILQEDLPPSEICVFSFAPHPLKILAPDRIPKMITGEAHKLAILEEWKIGHILFLPFNRERSLQSAGDFLAEMGTALPELRSISVGTRWRFGHRRQGDTDYLSGWCLSRGINLRVIEPVTMNDERISSSRIREAIANGALQAASDMLGRPYRIYGVVSQGQQLGRTLGFPTANLATLDECLPPLGVYAGYVRLDNRELPAVMNLGQRPTVGHPGSISIEAHILNYEGGEIYGEEVYFEPRHHLRVETKFKSLDDLKAAIERDILKARKILS